MTQPTIVQPAPDVQTVKARYDLALQHHGSHATAMRAVRLAWGWPGVRVLEQTCGLRYPEPTRLWHLTSWEERGAARVERQIHISGTRDDALLYGDWLLDQHPDRMVAVTLCLSPCAQAV